MMDALASEQLSLAFDLVVAVLLLATIVYATILNRKLTQLRSAKDEMAQLLEDFGRATERAEGGLKALREAAGEAGEALQRDITKGNAVADDLMFLVERAGGLADRLEGALAQSRKKGASSAGAARDKSAVNVADKAAVSEAAEEVADDEVKANSAFMEALRGIR